MRAHPPKARRGGQRRLGEVLTEGSYRVHQSSERGLPRLVESTPKLGEGLTEDSERGLPKARRGAHRRLVEGLTKARIIRTEDSDSAHRGLVESTSKVRREAHRRLVESTMKLGEGLTEGSYKVHRRSERAHRRSERGSPKAHREHNEARRVAH
jgi:hypothetical protein